LFEYFFFALFSTEKWIGVGKDIIDDLEKFYVPDVSFVDLHFNRDAMGFV